MHRIGIIGGSGFGDAFARGAVTLVKTQWGEAAITESRLESGVEIVFVARHGAGHKLPPHFINHRANIAALQTTGVFGVLATAAAGSLKAEIKPGDYVVLDDFIDVTKGEVATYTGPGEVRHLDMGAPYDEGLRAVLLQAAQGGWLGTQVHSRGTYVCLSGPRYETRAEVRMLAAWGGDVVGMTSAPEAILCRELGLPYAAVAIATNYGCGLLTQEVLLHADVEAQMAQSRQGLVRWLELAAEVIAKV